MGTTNQQSNHSCNQQWVLKRRPDGAIETTDLAFVESAIGTPEDTQVLVKTIYLSLDPTNRLWMSDREQYLPPVKLGDVMRGVSIGVVEQSRSTRFKKGDFVLSSEGGWQRYSIQRERALQKIIPADGVPLTAYLSILGPTGLTAYFGLLDICKPQSGETVVVSAAAGAVGSVVGQIAKIKGCRVIGIAGSEEKCQWIVDELGFDAAINYKSDNVADKLDLFCPDGVDMNFESVGGDIMDAVFSRLNHNGRMALCGMISGYNSEGLLSGPADFGRVLMNRITIKGFIVLDYMSQSKQAFAQISEWISEGRLQWKDHIVEGLEQAPSTIERLFTGNHDGKLIVQVADDTL